MKIKSIKILNPKNYSKVFLFFLLTLLLSVIFPLRIYSQKKNDGKKLVYGVAFLKSMFSNVDFNDAKAALKIYIDQLQKDIISGYEMKAVMFENVEDLLKTHTQYNLADITLNSVDFLLYKSRLALDPILVPAGKNSPYEKYYILVRKGNDINDIEQLKNKTLGILPSRNNPLPKMWLDVVLNEGKIRSGEKYFAKISQGKNESQLIMSVFFNQLNACIVSKTSFDLMSELNPQIKRELKILKTSPGFVIAVSSFTTEFKNSPFSKDLKEHLLYLDTYPAGRQLFTLMKTQRLILFKEEYLTSVKKLLKEYNRLPKEK